MHSGERSSGCEGVMSEGNASGLRMDGVEAGPKKDGNEAVAGLRIDGIATGLTSDGEAAGAKLGGLTATGAGTVWLRATAYTQGVRKDTFC